MSFLFRSPPPQEQESPCPDEPGAASAASRGLTAPRGPPPAAPHTPTLPATGSVDSAPRTSKFCWQDTSGVNLRCSKVLKMLRSPVANFIKYFKAEKCGTPRYQGWLLSSRRPTLVLIRCRIRSESEQWAVVWVFFKIMFLIGENKSCRKLKYSYRHTLPQTKQKRRASQWCFWDNPAVCSKSI